MEIQTAQILLYSITTVAGVIWVLGLYFLAQSARVSRPAPESRFEFDQPQAGTVIMGTVDVAGKPAELTATALSQIAANQTGTLGTLRILEKADNQITIQGVPSENPLESSSRHIQQGKLIFSNSMTGHTQVDYVVIVGNSIRVLLLVGALMQVLGLIAICTGFVLILTLVIPEPFPAIRWQTLQMMQVVHFLWPPFLFGSLYRRRFTSIKSAFAAFLSNLPYVKEK